MAPNIVSLATLYDRVDLLQQSIDSLYEQVDRIHLYLDGHDAVPSFLSGDSKFVIEHVPDRTRSLRASGKFFWCESLPDDCYHFTCDDDVIYPADYVDSLIDRIEHYDRQAVVGVHGVRFRPPWRFYQDWVNYNAAVDLPEDMRVHALGTGTLAYHVSTWIVRRQDFPAYNAEDLFVAICARRQNVPLICVARPRDWIKVQSVAGWSIHGEYLKTRDSSVQTAFLIAEGDWPDYPIPPANHAAIQRYYRERVARR
jgi:hypothetical protein